MIDRAHPLPVTQHCQAPLFARSLDAYDSVTDGRLGRAHDFTFCNQGRPYTALDGQTPGMVYFVPLPQREAA